LSIQLVTFGPGDDVNNYFGHNAIIVADEARGQALLYNFGMFSFGMDMLPRYMNGKLTFWVAAMPVAPTFRHYIEANRSVHVQDLDLDPAQRMLIAEAVATRALPENSEYLYDHYRDNCSTALRDVIDRGVGGQLRQALAKPARLTYRGHTRRYAERSPIVDFALVFWMNDDMERPLQVWDELFLPGELEKQVGRARYVDSKGVSRRLVRTSYAVSEARRAKVPDWPATTWPYTLLIGCAGGGLLLLTAEWLRRSGQRLARWAFGAQHALIGLTFGTCGLLGWLMWTFTEHLVTYRNENQLLANPITFLLLPIGVGLAFGSQRMLRAGRYAFYALAACSAALLVLKLLPTFDQSTLLPMTLLVPLNLGGALAHRALPRVSEL
jgi:hypothetical protein